MTDGMTVNPDSPFCTAGVSPAQVVAGDTVEFVITIKIEQQPAGLKHRFVFDFPGNLGFSRPSRLHQEDSGYLQLYCSNPDLTYDVKIWDCEMLDFIQPQKMSWRGMAARLGVVDVSGTLCPGNVLELHWGDTGGGYGSGTRVTTVVPRPDYACTIHVRYFSDPECALPDLGRDFDGYCRPIPDLEIPLNFSVCPRDVLSLRLLRKLNYSLLIPQDMFGNVAEVKQVSDFIGAETQVVKNPSNVYRLDHFPVTIHNKNLRFSETPNMQDAYEGMNIYWGDVHTHSSHSNDCIEREKMDMHPDRLLSYGKHVAGLDFAAVTDHHEPHHIPRNQIGQQRWETLIEAVRKHDHPGEFLVFPGFEYRCSRGDTVVLLNWLAQYDEINREQWQDIRYLWNDLAGKDILTIPHFHNPGKLADGEWWHTESLVEPVLEIFSCHGSYERCDALEHHIPLIKSSRPDRYGDMFLQKGFHYGFVCNSDGHKGHIGSNGLTAVFAQSLEKAEILSAIRKRQVYGTTNARMRLIFTANGQLMGSILPAAGDKQLYIDVTGEQTLKKVEVFRNSRLAYRYTPSNLQFQTHISVTDEEPSYWTVRATQVDNHIAFSSPIWFK